MKSMKKNDRRNPTPSSNLPLKEGCSLKKNKKERGGKINGRYGKVVINSVGVKWRGLTITEERKAVNRKGWVELEYVIKSEGGSSQVKVHLMRDCAF